MHAGCCHTRSRTRARTQDPSGDAAASAQKHLTYYELDLGLNHVLRKWSEPIDNGANMLVPVPGGGDGPGGVLVCCENFVLYRHQVGTPDARRAGQRAAQLAAAQLARALQQRAAFVRLRRQLPQRDACVVPDGSNACAHTTRVPLALSHGFPLTHAWWLRALCPRAAPQGVEEVRAVLPRREDLSGERGVLIVAAASHKKKGYSFFLLQVRRLVPMTGDGCCMRACVLSSCLFSAR